MTKIFISSSNPKNNIAAGMTTGGGIGRSISTVTFQRATDIVKQTHEDSQRDEYRRRQSVTHRRSF